MIIDYKNELLHQHTAISAICFAHEQFLSNIIGCEEFEEDNKSETSYFAPLNAILSCIAGSHKLDHIRLCCDLESKQSRIYKEYLRIFNKQDKVKESVAMYQSAKNENSVDKMKPYQIINSFLSELKLTSAQKAKAQEWHQGLSNAFDLSKTTLSLKKGQRLYKGVSLTSENLNKYFSAMENDIFVEVETYYSTSLSESIALAFAFLSDSKRIGGNLNAEADEDVYVPVVIELTNRDNGLPFIMPDAIRKPEHSQGQMEILLPPGLKLQPTHIDSDGRYVKIYADILSDNHSQ